MALKDRLLEAKLIAGKLVPKNAPVPVAIRKYKSYKRIRWACRLFTAGAISVSIWANTLFAAGPIAIALVSIPPLLVLGALELVSRVRIGSGGWLRRFSRPAATIAIAVMAGWLSYWTQRAAISLYLPDKDHAMLLPLVIDGFMVIASVTLTEVNDRIEQIEAVKEVTIAARKAREESKPEQPTTRGDKREAIAKLLSRSPEMGAKEIAKKVKCAPSYAAKCLRELKSELVSA
jgi:hypothetical protein